MKQPGPKPRPAFPARLPSGTPAPAPARPRSAPVSATARPVPSGVGMDSSTVRAAMVRKLQAQGISHPAVVAAMLAVERHRFVDSALVNQAYEDTSLPIGQGQTISKPGVVARMIELLCQAGPQPLGRLLEIGTGCGYQAAVLSQVAREVYSIERIRALHEKARDNLRALRVPNLHLILGDGMQGFARGAPYAGIIAAAGGNDIPAAWIDQLAVGGRLVAPAVTSGSHQNLVVIDKTARGIVRTELEAVHFVPLKSGIA